MHPLQNGQPMKTLCNGFGWVCFSETGFQKITFQLSCICLPLEKLVNKKYFPVNEKYFLVKEKFGLVFRKMFSFYFEPKTLSGSCEKFRNVIISNLVLKLLIAIYILFWIFVFQFHPAHFQWHNQILEIVFQLIFHYTTKHRKIIHFSGIHFSKKTTFQQTNRVLVRFW